MVALVPVRAATATWRKETVERAPVGPAINRSVGADQQYNPPAATGADRDDHGFGASAVGNSAAPAAPLPSSDLDLIIKGH